MTEQPTTDATAQDAWSADDDQQDQMPHTGTPTEGTEDDSSELDHDDDQHDDDAEGDDSTATPLKAARKEAGKYRRQLRDTEAERDDLKAQLEAAQWGQIKSHFKAMKSAEPLKAAGYNVSDFLNDEGEIDPDLAQKVERNYAQSIGLHISVSSRTADLGAGKRGSWQGGGTPSWSDAIQSRSGDSSGPQRIR